MKILTIYEGTTLLSISYCNRMLDELNKKNTLAHIREFDVTKEDPKIDSLRKKISHYGDIVEELKKNFANIEDNDLINFVVDQMILKIKESKLTKISISFCYINEYTVQITIDNIFSTELTFKSKVYEASSCPNEHYDGYNDKNEYISTITQTSFFEEITSTIKKAINDELPKITIQ